MAPRLILRIDFNSGRAIGPGKIRLLEAIREHGSISQAGRRLGMSYRRAWLLIDDLNRCFAKLLVKTKLGGTAGGGARLTSFGERVLTNYRAIEKSAHRAAATRLRMLDAALGKSPVIRRRGTPLPRTRRARRAI